MTSPQRMDVESLPFDEADNMCPNCITPWKCNGPHLYKQTRAWRNFQAAQQPADFELAPWTDEQVRNLNLYQQSGVMHEFTYPNAHADRVLIATNDGLCCPAGDYMQDWTYRWITDGSWQAAGFERPSEPITKAERASIEQIVSEAIAAESDDN